MARRPIPSLVSTVTPNNRKRHRHPNARMTTASSTTLMMPPAKLRAISRCELQPRHHHGGLQLTSGRRLIETLPPKRDWLCGTFLQTGAVALVVGAPGAGKSTYALHIGCAVAEGQDWGGDRVSSARSVIIVSAEDGRDEIKRRLIAIDQVMHLSDEAKDRLHVIVGQPIALGADPKENQGRSRVLNDLVEAIKALKVDLVIFDPLVELHNCDENNNADMNHVIRDLRWVAHRTGCAVLVVHHSGKSTGVAGDQNASRGASSVIGAVRAIRTVVVLDEDDAAAFGIADETAKDHIRVDGAKSNYARLGGALLFRKESVVLPNTDDVGVLVPVGIPDACQTAIRTALRPDKAAIAAAAVELISDKLSVNKLATRLLTERSDLLPGFSAADPAKPSQKLRDLILAAVQQNPAQGAWTLSLYSVDGRGGNSKVTVIEKVPAEES